LVLDGLFVGLLVYVDAFVAGQPEKRLTGTLRIYDFLSRPYDAEGAFSGSLIGLTLTFGYNVGDFGGFNIDLVVRLQNIVDLLIAVFGDIGQFVAKVLHAVEGVLKGIFIGAVLFCDLGGLVGALTKRIPDGVGGNSLLPDEGCRDGVL
jgi:hypothetical protein